MGLSQDLLQRVPSRALSRRQERRRLSFWQMILWAFCPSCKITWLSLCYYANIRLHSTLCTSGLQLALDFIELGGARQRRGLGTARLGLKHGRQCHAAAFNGIMPAQLIPPKGHRANCPDEVDGRGEPALLSGRQHWRQLFIMLRLLPAHLAVMF